MGIKGLTLTMVSAKEMGEAMVQGGIGTMEEEEGLSMEELLAVAAAIFFLKKYPRGGGDDDGLGRNHALGSIIYSDTMKSFDISHIIDNGVQGFI
jgi:hypothetical protein